MDKEIAMAHPNIPGQIAHAFKQAFDEVWVQRGWVEVDEPTEEPPDVVAAPKVEVAPKPVPSPPVTTPPVTTPQGEVGTDG